MHEKEDDRATGGEWVASRRVGVGTQQIGQRESAQAKSANAQKLTSSVWFAEIADAEHLRDSE